MTGHRRDGSLDSGAAGLCTDLYELRMVESYLKRGMTAPAIFSLYLRPKPARPWYVAYGLERLTELFDSFRYGPAELAYLADVGLDRQTLAWLEAFEASGEVWAVPDGTVVLAGEPIAEVTAPMPVAQLLETAAINLVHYATLVATKAARCALVADGRRLADFGFRRAHGLETGVQAALAAWVGGGFATSNVEAGRRYGLPVTGTMAHSYVQAFPDESEAFRAFAADHPAHSILLVDTYDTAEGVRRAIRAAQDLGITPRGVRLDSGDLAALAKQARALLDDAGYADTLIIASGGVDEYRIHELLSAGAPIDAFGVGTALVVSSDEPALDIVYKLVAYDGRPVAKYSGSKETLPGPKQVFRPDTGPDGDVLSTRDDRRPGEALLTPLWRDGATLRAEDHDSARQRVVSELDRLPRAWRAPPYPHPAPVPQVAPALRRLDDEVRRAARAS